MIKKLISTLMICGAGFAFSDSVVTFGKYYGVTSDGYSKFHDEILGGELKDKLNALDDVIVDLTNVLLQHDTLTDEQKYEYASVFIYLMKQAPLPIVSKLVSLPSVKPFAISKDKAILLTPERDGNGYTIDGFDQLTNEDKEGYRKFAAELTKVNKENLAKSLPYALNLIDKLQEVKFQVVEINLLAGYGIEVRTSVGQEMCYEQFNTFKREDLFTDGTNMMILSDKHILVFKANDIVCDMIVMSSKSSDDANE